MQAHARYRQRRRKIWIARKPEIAKQIHDGRRCNKRRVAQREIARGAHELLKLAGDATALTLVIAVVGAWRQFVHQQFALARYEDLNAEKSLDAEFRDNVGGQ